MSLNSSVNQIHPGFGSPTVQLQRLNVVTNAGNTTVTLPVSGSFSPTTITKGWLRVRTNSIGVNATFKIINISGTDGTSTDLFSTGQANLTGAGQRMEFLIPFITELNLTSISISVNVNTNNSTMDFDLAGVQ